MSPAFCICMPQNPGDVIMALHAAAELRRMVPHASVDFVAGEECSELASALGGTLLRRVFPIPFSKLRHASRAGDFEGVLRATRDWVRGLEETRYALSLNLFQGHFGAFIQSLIRAERKVGLELQEGSRLAVEGRILRHLFAVPAQRAQNPFHAVDLYRMAAAEALGFPLPTASAPALPALKAENPCRFAPQSYAAFHPGAAHAGKRWPAENWKRLARLCLEAGMRIAWTGSPEERDGVASLVDSEKGDAQVNLAGSTSLPQAAAVYGDARVVVSGDTVAMHAAAAMRTPAIALFGPSNPVETGPYGIGHIVIQPRPVISATLDFENEYGLWPACRPEALAAFILNGKTDGFEPDTVWRTDQIRGLQILRDEDGKIHPFQKNLGIWVDLFGKGGKLQIGSDLEAETALESPAKVLQKALDHPSPKNIRELENHEKAWAEKTENDLVWEAYRIALNGLPLHPLPHHLALRREILRQACLESHFLGIVSDPRGGVK